MKKIITLLALVMSFSTNAFWNNNNWNNNYGYGYYDDNGIFGYNPYDFWDPRWYFEEMDNMMDEFDEGWNDDYYGPYNNYRYAPHGYINTPWGPGVAPAPAASIQMQEQSK